MKPSHTQKFSFCSFADELEGFTDEDSTLYNPSSVFFDWRVGGVGIMRILHNIIFLLYQVFLFLSPLSTLRVFIPAVAFPVSFQQTMNGIWRFFSTLFVVVVLVKCTLFLVLHREKTYMSKVCFLLLTTKWPAVFKICFLLLRTKWPAVLTICDLLSNGHVCFVLAAHQRLHQADEKQCIKAGVFKSQRKQKHWQILPC